MEVSLNKDILVEKIISKQLELFKGKTDKLFLYTKWDTDKVVNINSGDTAIIMQGPIPQKKIYV